ncbi:MAG: aminoacyl-tRNA hydrolase [Treponema sp.]|jgi:PTH1 family peptidyl-tRNA hydrolase|nr:aminoacyl-tRNA hydrolase [Treponema sp.]
MIELAAFLGNPGREYEKNRHNAGRLLAEKLPFFSRLAWQKKYKGLYAALDGDSIAAETGFPVPSRLHFLMPETFMNLSGESVCAAASFFKIKPEAVIVVHDELELPLGTVSFKFSGGLGGHNGLRSMKACFGTADFWRLRIGIGRPDGRKPGEGGPEGSGKGIYDWVLSDFSPAEEAVLAEILPPAAAALAESLLKGPESLLPEWKKKKIEITETGRS